MSNTEIYTNICTNPSPPFLKEKATPERQKQPWLAHPMSLLISPSHLPSAKDLAVPALAMLRTSEGR